MNKYSQPFEFYSPTLNPSKPGELLEEVGNIVFLEVGVEVSTPCTSNTDPSLNKYVGHLLKCLF